MLWKKALQASHFQVSMTERKGKGIVELIMSLRSITSDDAFLLNRNIPIWHEILSSLLHFKINELVVDRINLIEDLSNNPPNAHIHNNTNECFLLT